MRPGPSGYPPMFYAQSWIVMHYLLNQNKLSEAGTYFGLVQIRKVPVEQAIQQAFGMSAAQLRTGGERLLSLLRIGVAGPTQHQSGRSAPGSAGITSSLLRWARSMSEPVSWTSPMPRRKRWWRKWRCVCPNIAIRARKISQTIIADPKGDNAIAHRATGLGPHGEKRIRSGKRGTRQSARNSTAAIPGHTTIWRW